MTKEVSHIPDRPSDDTNEPEDLVKVQMEDILMTDEEIEAEKQRKRVREVARIKPNQIAKPSKKEVDVSQEVSDYLNDKNIEAESSEK